MMYLWNVRQDKLTKFPEVLRRFTIREGIVSEFHKPSPRLITLGLYNFIFILKARVRSLQKEIQGYRKYVSQLQERIKELEDYEKQVVYRDWRAVITCFTWTCGDGCCSDSSYGYQIINEHNQIVKEEDMQGFSRDASISSHTIEERIRRDYGSAVEIRHETHYEE